MTLLAFFRRNALVIVLLLMCASLGLTAYTVTALANERTDAIIRECHDQNQRHDHTVAELDVLLARAEKHAPPAQRKQMAASRQFTILLIDQLAPRQNCAKAAVRANHP